jgi:hypothetical protein
MIDQQDNLSAARIIIPLLFVVAGIAFLMWIGTKPEPVPVPDVTGCFGNLSIPKDPTDREIIDGRWKIMQDADKKYIATLVSKGKAKVIMRPTIKCNGVEVSVWYWRAV